MTATIRRDNTTTEQKVTCVHDEWFDQTVNKNA